MKLKYVPCLDGIRAVALGITFAGHAGLGSFIPGTFGVTIFFFLSGYLITSLLRAEWSETQDISLRKFYYRRALRILPPLYIILALGWTLDSFGIPVHQGTGFALVSILLYFYNYAMLTKLSLGGIPVGFSVFWSLMVEEHFYLIFPFIYLLVRKIAWPTRYLVNALIGVNIIVLIWRIVLIYVFHTPANTYGWAYLATDARFDSILWGCVLAVGANPWAGDKNRFMGHNPGRIALASLFLLAGVIALRNPDFAYSIRPTLQGVALMPIFYYLVASPGSRWARLLASPPLRWLGLVSYTMYLTHDWIMQSLRIWLPGHLAITAVCALALSALLSEAVRRGVENPIRRIKRRKHLEAGLAANPA